MLYFNCTIKGFSDGTYGKYGSDNEDTTVIMEYGQMFPALNPYLPINLKLN